MTDALARARADLAAGRAWKARDRLRGLLTHRQDDEVVDLLATVHAELGDLPEAGALWRVTGRRDAVADEARAAWRERYGDDAARWASIPGPVRRARAAELADLRPADPRRTAAQRRQQAGSLLGSIGCVLVLLWIVVAAVIGTVTVVAALH